MKTYNDLYTKLYSLDNLFLAYKKARKRKTKKDYVLEFDEDLINNLLKLQRELENLIYKPQPLKTFIIRDPKLRKISKSEFVDRIVHHALINVIGFIFDKTFIHDSCANRKGKGTSKAIERLKIFIKKATKNYKIDIFFLKADIKKYFDNVDHDILLNIIGKKIKDRNIIDLIQLILNNHCSKLGMPLGNLTSQFFANIYLNELDYFIKYELKIKYYIRYVDDFVILHNNKHVLEFYKQEINNFLRNTLSLELHKDKSKIYFIDNGINFLGFRHFDRYSLLKMHKRKIIKNKLTFMLKEYKEVNSYGNLMRNIESVFSYIEHENTFNLRRNLVNKINLKLNTI